MRLFVGYLIPDHAKSRIVELQREISEAGIECKHVEKENLHINFSFLGESGDEDAGKIKKDLDGIANEFKKIEVNLKGVKAIPNKKFTRVLALDVSDSEGILLKIMDEIIKRIGGDVKPPHVTICRIKSAKNKQRIISFVEKYEHSDFGKMRIESIQLIESKLGRFGPEYSIVGESSLKD
jgi:2'-5' RNA ligase